MGVKCFEKSEADHCPVTPYHRYLDTSKLNLSSSFSIIFGSIIFHTTFHADVAPGSVETGSVEPEGPELLLCSEDIISCGGKRQP